mgnify:CR=1 FL=1
MSTPNPLVPQGSLLEQQAKSKSTFQVAAFIVALHVVILGGLLFLGCKKEEKLAEPNTADTLISPPAVMDETNALPVDPFAVPPNASVAPLDPGASAVVPGANSQSIAPVVPSLPMDTLPTFSGGTTEHVVQKGDASYKIAKKHGITLKQLQDANPGIDLAKLKLNQKLQVPAASSAPAGSATAFETASTPSATTLATHVVKGGDNLSRIAKKYGVSVKEIRTANGLKSNDIKVGQKLKIPASAASGGAKSAPGSGTVTQPPDNVPFPAVTPGQPVNP